MDEVIDSADFEYDYDDKLIKSYNRTYEISTRHFMTKFHFQNFQREFKKIFGDMYVEEPHSIFLAGATEAGNQQIILKPTADLTVIVSFDHRRDHFVSFAPENNARIYRINFEYFDPKEIHRLRDMIESFKIENDSL